MRNTENHILNQQGQPALVASFFVIESVIRFIDMFSGIGGFREGLTRAGGFACVGHCEIDKYANRSYNALFDTKGEWFTHEGQQKIETHGDKLMNYIRFWQAAGESEKTSIRTRDRIRQIVSSGHYTGGFVCYGYQLVDQGRRNKRDKPVMDLVINEEEATWVRELFYKVIQEGTSGYALAEMLNNRGLRTRAGAKFQSSNILRIIRHEGYTGYIITKNARSEYIPELQIIDQETFEKANDIISRRSAKTAQDRRIAHTSQNPTLLAGIVYCAHC